MRTRILVRCCLLITVLVVTGLVEAQQQKKIPRIGYLQGGSIAATTHRIEAFRQGLRDLGYVEGKNIAIEWRTQEGTYQHILDRLPALAAELVRLQVSVIVATGSGDVRAAREATATIPIVMIVDSDPVGRGFVASLARPGGIITGLTNRTAWTMLTCFGAPLFTWTRS